MGVVPATPTATFWLAGCGGRVLCQPAGSANTCRTVASQVGGLGPHLLSCGPVWYSWRSPREGVWGNRGSERIHRNFSSPYCRLELRPRQVKSQARPQDHQAGALSPVSLAPEPQP